MPETLIEVDVPPAYQVIVGPNLLARASRDLPSPGSSALLADERVLGLYESELGPLADLPRLALTGGESVKTFPKLERVLHFLAEARLDRRSTLYTLGGGTVLDLGGLAASLFKRGIHVVHLPTTLLAQVDASVGGKTAINLAAGKNLVGTFYQPKAVFADTSTLATLTESDWRSGLGECVKTAMIGGESAFDRLEVLAADLRQRDPRAVHEIVAACVRTKATVVASDPHESGPREVLNLGHTFAHGIEHATDFEVPHGVAVALGLRLAVRTCDALGELSDADLDARLTQLLEALDLPTEPGDLPALERLGAEGPQRIVDGMAHDKKGAVGAPRLVLPRALGKMEASVAVAPATLLDILRGS